MVRKFILFINIILCLLLISCSANNSDNTTQDDSVLEPIETSTQVDELFNDDFTIYARTKSSSYKAIYITADENYGSIVDENVYIRNELVENKYGIKFNIIDSKEPTSTLEEDLNSGEIEYDLILDCRNSLSKYAIMGYLYDFNSLDLDLTAAWWDTNCVRDLSIKNHCYMMQNSASIARSTGIRFLYFNKNIVDSYHLADPYALLYNDTWTLENFITMIRGVSNELGDSELGVHALVLETGASNGVYMHLLTGCGVNYTNFTSNGELTCTVDDSIEKIDNVFSRLYDVFSNKKYVIRMSEAVKLDVNSIAHGDNVYDKARSLFAQGHFLFTHGSINVSSQFVNMQDEFGCMPNPKFDENQNSYLHKCDPFTLIFAIPNASSINKNKVAKVMDYWGYESENLVVLAYYEITIKSKRISDPTAMQVIDIVRNTARHEFLDVFRLGDISNMLNDAYNNRNMASAWQENKNIYLEKINQFNSSIK